MGKLRTPFVYESKLSGLAESFPLSLQDESRLSVGLGVCDIQPADSNPPAVGRFLHTTDQGSLLTHHYNDLDNIVDAVEILAGGTLLHHTDFGRTVNGVTVRFLPVATLILFFWMNPDFNIQLNTMVDGVRYYLPFRGRHIYFLIDTDNGGMLNLYGFY